jgi:dipeptidyl aminopeptidase/acylaminoacyl peptidase
MQGVRVIAIACLAAGAFAALAGSSRASFPGANGKLFFVGQAHATADPVHLYSVAADGTDLVQLTSGPASEQVARVAPGGASVVFARDTNEQCGHLYWAQGVDLFTVHADGTGLTRVTNNCPISDSTPAWSPSGTRIVMSRFGYLWSMKTDGTELAKLTCPTGRGDGGDYFPAWSPDGRSIAFNRLGDIYAMSANGDNQHFVTAGFGPSFSPDGTKLAFDAPSESDAGIYTISVDGGTPVRLTTGSDGSPVWSPDGTKIAFIHRSGTQMPAYAIQVMNSDGTDVHTVMDTLDAGWVDWAQAGASAAGTEPSVTAAGTACAETEPTPPTAAAPSPPAIAPAAPLGSLDAAQVAAPDRLTVSGVAFRPSPLRTRKAFAVTVVVRDLAGRVIRGASVQIFPQRGDANRSAPVATGSDGRALLRVSPTRRLALRTGGRLVLAVRARRPGDPWSSQVSALRLVSVRTATPTR